MKSGIKVLAAFILGVATVPLVVIASAWLGLFAVNATDPPSSWEEELAERALDTALERSAKGLAAPFADDEQALLAGLRLYRNNCSGCHGDFKAPSSWGTKNYYPRVPQFTDPAPTMSVPEMFVATKYGIRYSGMGAWNGMMPDEDIWRVSMFLSRLGSLPPEVDARWRKGPGGAGS